MAYFIPVPTNIETTPDVASTYGVPMAFISGFEMKYVSNTVFTVQPGNANAENNGATIQYPSVLPTLPGIITVDITQLAGPGLLQGNQVTAGTSGYYPTSIPNLGLSAHTTFAVYVIGDSSGFNNPIVVLATGNNFVPNAAPPLRSYDSFRRIGFITIDNTTGFILPFIQSGSFTDREYMFANDVQVLSAGTATVPTIIDLSINNGPIVPGPTSQVKFVVGLTPNAAGDDVSFVPTGLTSSSYPVFVQNPGAARLALQIEMIPGVDPVNGHAAIDYLNSTALASTDVFVAGFTDSLRLQVV
jgi:hypothetical protein